MDNYKKIFEAYVDFSAEAHCLRDVVYEGLRGAILDGHIRTGSRIVEKRFADQMNISRTPVREALKRLESEGFIEYVPNVGAVVRCVEEDDVAEMYEAKKVLERLMLKRIIDNVSDDDLEALRHCLSEFELQIRQRNASEIIRLYDEFQRTLRKLGSNKTICQLLTTLDQSYNRFKKQIDFQLVDLQLLYFEAAGVVRAIESKDLGALEKANEEKLTVMCHAILKNMGREISAV